MAAVRRSVAVIPFDAERRAVLLLHRAAWKGGGWQPVTGRVEDADAEGAAQARCARERAACEPVGAAARAADHDVLVAAALRELAEETGITRVDRVLDLGLETTFTGYDGHTYREHAFAIAVAPGATVTPSPEHDAHRWVPFADAADVLTFPENAQALARLVAHVDAET